MIGYSVLGMCMGESLGGVAVLDYYLVLVGGAGDYGLDSSVDLIHLRELTYGVLPSRRRVSVSTTHSSDD
jgi:hypothetical protein